MSIDYNIIHCHTEWDFEDVQTKVWNTILEQYYFSDIDEDKLDNEKSRDFLFLNSLSYIIACKVFAVVDHDYDATQEDLMHEIECIVKKFIEDIGEIEVYREDN